MNFVAARWIAVALLLAALAATLFGCGDDAPTPPVDASVDSGGNDAAPPRVDARPRADGGLMLPDAGPAATGCHLLNPVDAGARVDGGTSDAGPEVDSGVSPDAGTALPPDGYPPLPGPGGPVVPFEASELLTACAYLDGGPTDRDHHNTAFMLDGYLYMPWAHEAGHGGISVFELADPCNPVHVATVTDDQMRETHATGVSTNGGRHLVVASLTGIQFWDVSDPTAPLMVHDMVLPGVRYPNSYARVVLSTFWQAPYVYVGAADNGVFIVDATNPAAPGLVATYEPIPEIRVGGVHVIGNLMVVQSTEGSRTNLVDVSDPARPRHIPGGTFLLTDGTADRFGRPTLMLAYFGHVNGGRAYYARHVLGGGLITFDISDPSAPAFAGSWASPPISNGGYVFVKEGVAFVGLSDYAHTVDVSDPTNLQPLDRFELTGDFDTLTPIGNVTIASVDDDATPDRASAVIPYQTAVDSRAPQVNMVVPSDEQTAVALSARVGLTFDEFVEMATVYRGSVRVQVQGTGIPLEGWYSGQEGALNFWPREPLRPETTYEVVVPAGGVRDYAGNPTDTEFRSTFTTVACD